MATQCSEIQECEHWEWDKDTQVCKFVKTFDGFEPERRTSARDKVRKIKKFATGHRWCNPMGPAPTILNMCPDNNEVTYMWRNKDDDFYNPNIGVGGKSSTNLCRRLRRPQPAASLSFPL